jgi:hypothetical protein
VVQDVVELVPLPLLAGRQPDSAQFPLAVGGIMSPGRGGAHSRFMLAFLAARAKSALDHSGLVVSAQVRRFQMSRTVRGTTP